VTPKSGVTRRGALKKSFKLKIITALEIDKIFFSQPLKERAIWIISKTV